MSFVFYGIPIFLLQNDEEIKFLLDVISIAILFVFLWLSFWNYKVSIELFGNRISIWIYSFCCKLALILLHDRQKLSHRCISISVTTLSVTGIIFELVKMGKISKKHWQEEKNKISVIRFSAWFYEKTQENL